MQRTALALLLVMHTLLSNGQQNCDCAKAEALKPSIGNYFNQGQLDSARILIQQIKGEKTRICEVLYHNGMSQVAMAKGDLKSARSHLDKEYALLKALKCPQRLSKHYTNYSTYYNFQNQYDSAVFVALKGVDAAIEARDTLTQIRLYCNIGAFFDQMKQFDNTLKYEKNALELVRTFDDVHSRAMVYSQISGTYLSLYERSKKADHLKDAFKTAREGVRNARAAGELILALDSYNILSKSHYLKKQDVLAIAYADSILLNTPRAIDYFNRNLQEAFLRKSEVYFRQKNYAEAKVHADSSVWYGNKFNVLVTIEPLRLLYHTNKKLGLYADALSTFEQMKSLEDSLFSLEKNDRIAELERKYNQVKNEQTIRELQQEDEIKGLRIRVLVVLIVVALFGLFLILLIFRQKQLKKNQQLMETEQRLNRSRMNPHFFFNALTTLQGLAIRENDGKKIALNLSKFSSLMRKTLESTYADFISIEKELQFIQQYIALQQLKNPELFAFHVHCAEDLEIEEILIPSMIIQPFLENAIEHGFAHIDYPGELILEFSQQGTALRILILDNGSGFSKKEEENAHISRATQITKERLQLLKTKARTDAHFSIHERQDGGVQVEIVLPLLFE